MSLTRIKRAGQPLVTPASDGRLTIPVPIRIQRRSGRKLPNGECAQPIPWDVAATPLQLAVSRGHRWLAMVESGTFKSLNKIAKREGG